MLAIIRGLPGSGKSTFARHAFKNFNQLEADQFHMIGDVYDYKIENASYAHMLCQARCARHLKNGWDVVVANTFTTKFEILPYVRMAIHFQTTYEIYRMSDDFQWKSIHNVPDQVVEKMRSSLKKHHLSGESVISVIDGNYITLNGNQSFVELNSIIDEIRPRPACMHCNQLIPVLNQGEECQICGR